MNLGEKKMSEISDRELVRGLVFMAKEGLCSKEEILEKIDIVNKNLDEVGSAMAELQDAGEHMDAACENSDASESMRLVEEYGSREDIQDRYKKKSEEQAFWGSMLKELEDLLATKKNFDKTLCFSNIRELLRKNPDVKIGQIEKEAGIRLGYMSRLEKDGNTSEPSIEFIVTAAKLLKVSVDTLISVNLTGMTPTEQYLVKFFDKLKADTLADKLDWNKESKFILDRIEPDMNGFIHHPLFSEETFYEESDGEYPNEVTRIVFSSKTFGPRTAIADDCFNLRLKNGTTLYLMDISKSVYKMNDPAAFAKEAWVYVPATGGSSLLVASQDNTPIAPLLETLFATVKDRMEHPKVNKDIMYAIDAFLKDDMDDDDDDGSVPF